MNGIIMNEGYKNLKNHISSGIGSHIFINNKKNLDLSCCAGSLILGHNSKIFKDSLKDILKLNISNFAAKNLHAIRFINILKKIFPNYHSFIFCNSGTEAIMKSLRIARAVSKKNLIISVSGSWHGSTSELLFKSDNKQNKFDLSDGLDKNYKRNLKFIPYNNIELSKKILDKNKRKIMCIIIEPIQGSLPINAKNYLHFLDNYSKKNNIILIFDEMITGLRFNCSSVQNEFKLDPRISTFGKCFGGGLPIGIIALKKNIVEKLKKNKQQVFFGGTFSGNSINTYVAQKTVEYIIKNKKKIFSSLENKACFLEKKINKFFIENNYDAKCYKFSSMLRIVFSNKKVFNRPQRDFLEENKKDLIHKFQKFLLDKKIYLSNSGIIFLATSTSKKDILYLIDTIKNAFKYLSKKIVTI